MGFLTFIKKNENARKIFGKRELKIIEKQLLGINLTQSEKNRLSRDIRKKFQFIKDAIKFSDDFSLKKGAHIKEIVSETIQVILAQKFHKRIKWIKLYGSTVTNERSFRSDIDIAVNFNKISSKEAIQFRMHILGEAHNSVDIKVYNTLPPKIKKEIDKNGRELYRKNSGKSKTYQTVFK
jgi:predicted nucleotidyltransferase